MKKIITCLYLLLPAVYGLAQVSRSAPQVTKTNLEKDKESIRSMAGCYKVNFSFAETFAPDTAYKYHNRKFEWGIEYVTIVEDTDTKISLQHLLIVDDSTIIKHWRQEWVYENTALLNFYKDNEWKKIKLTPEQAKGTWTQKVYQVDDGPRYESYGTWIHTDGRHYWESSCDAPLPRREFSKRSDYNVMKRHSHIEINSDGWELNQDNEKIIRANGIDQLLCMEKGIEKFTKGNYNAQPAADWWEKNKQYWSDVRKVWSEVYVQNNTIKIEKKVNNKILYEQLFKIGDEFTKTKSYNSPEATAAIKKTIESYLVKN